MKTFSSNGIKLNFLEQNENLPNAIIFVHGNSHSLNSFSGQMNAPKLNNYRLIFVDLPGHGGSSRDGNYSLKNIGLLFAEFMNSLNAERIIIVGHSLGGHVALGTLKYSTPHGLFIFGTPPLKNPLDPNGFLPNEKTSALAQTKPSLEEIDNLLTEMGYNSDAKKNATTEFLNTDPVFRQEILGDICAGQHVDEVELINSFTGDLLILLATKDRLVNNNYIREIFHNEDSPAKLQEIDAGHCPHSEKSGEFNQLLSDFCNYVFDKNINASVRSKALQPESNYYEQRN